MATSASACAPRRLHPAPAAASNTPGPGNVRQLENAVARLLAMSAGGEIGPDDLPAEAGGAQNTWLQRCAGPAAANGELSLREQLHAVERGIIQRAMAAAGGNQSEAARRLGMSRGTLIDRLRRYGIGAEPGGPGASPPA